MIEIITEKDYNLAMIEVEKLWNSEPNTPEGIRFMELVDAIEIYEEKHYPIGESSER